MAEGANSPVQARVAMSAEQTLGAYERRASLQNLELSSYSATSRIRAELPGTRQSGELELQRSYAAPRSLKFRVVRFAGDTFVKKNVIVRLLQSEVDHLQKDDPSLTALTALNYKFSSKGRSEVNGREVQVFQVKPRRKEVGLFKGRIYLDAYTGTLVRSEGGMVKSPSVFIKSLAFVQDYADFGNFTFPVHLHSVAKTRILGPAIVDVDERDYQPVASSVESSASIAPSL